MSNTNFGVQNVPAENVSADAAVTTYGYLARTHEGPGYANILNIEMAYVASLFLCAVGLLVMGHKLRSSCTQFAVSYIFFVWIYVLGGCENANQVRFKVATAFIMGMMCGLYAAAKKCIGNSLLGFVSFGLFGGMIAGLIEHWMSSETWFVQGRLITSLCVCSLACVGASLLEFRSEPVSRCAVGFISAHVVAESFCLLLVLCASAGAYGVDHKYVPVVTPLNLRSMCAPLFSEENTMIYSSWKNFHDSGLAFTQLYPSTRAYVEYFSVPSAVIETTGETLATAEIRYMMLVYLGLFLLVLTMSTSIHNRAMRSNFSEKPRDAKQAPKRPSSVYIVTQGIAPVGPTKLYSNGALV